MRGTVAINTSDILQSSSEGVVLRGLEAKILSIHNLNFCLISSQVQLALCMQQLKYLSTKICFHVCVILVARVAAVFIIARHRTPIIV